MRFQDYQRAFTDRIRDPRAGLPNKVTAGRMRVYEHLLFNNIESFLLAGFPVCRKVLGQRRWLKLVRAFYRDHVSHTPYFRRVPEEFLRYLQDEAPAGIELPEFLPELAHYEWVELALDTSDQDAQLPAHNPAGDLLAGRPLVNPVLRVLAYRWPVHRLSPRYRPKQPPAETTFLLAHRDRDLKVRFTVINALTARLLTLLQEQPQQSGEAVLYRLAEAIGSDAVTLMVHAASLLNDLRAQDVILGTLI